MKVLSLFTGIGAFEKALKNIGINYELVGFSEIDKYAIKSYCAIHNVDEKINLGDITKINISKLPKDIDMITHGSPCQDFSIAGKQAGGDLGTGTRSSLMWNTINIVTYCKPKYVIWENVKNLLSKKHRHNFDSYLTIMESLGYNNYYQVLNAKDYGIPQNRERVYTISIRKDIDKGNFKFPEKEELKLRLKDMLEDEVDEKYYLKNEKNIKYNPNFYATKKYSEKSKEKIKRNIIKNNIVNTITANCMQSFNHDNCAIILEKSKIEAKVNRIGGIFDTEKSKHQAGSIYDKEQLAPTLDAMQGGWRQPSIIENKKEIVLIKNATKKGYMEAIEGDSVNLSYPESNTRRGRVGKEVSQTLQCKDSMEVVVGAAMRGRYNQNGEIKQCLEISKKEEANAITTVQKDSLIKNDLRIRKLTPKECWRLMGFSDEDFEKAANVPTSNTQLYKQARKFNCCKCFRRNIFKFI